MTFARGCFGWLVEEIQEGLVDKGIEVKVDGVFGPLTEDAVKKWQDWHGFIPNGRVTESVFTGITEQQQPSLFERCAQLTAAFEGMNFTRVVEHDGDIGYGFLTFSLKWGHIKKILTYDLPFKPEIVSQAPCGEQRFRYLVNIETPNSEFVAEVNKQKLAWMHFLSRLDTQEAQLEYTLDAFWEGIAKKDHDRLIELGVADGPRLWGMCFDHAVQSGGLTKEEEKAFLTLRSSTKLPELVALANAMADHAKPQYRDDVLSRRLVFAMGSGVVHGKNYLTVDWGVDRLVLDYAGTTGQETPSSVQNQDLDQESSGFFKKVMEMGDSIMSKSYTFWTGVVAVISGILAQFGIIPAPIGLDKLTPENQQLVLVIIQVCGYVLGVIGAQGIFQRRATAKVEKKLKEIAPE